MGKKLLKTLTNNIGFKLLALLFAVILWLVVYNVDDPVVSRIYMTNVKLENTDVIKDKYYEILDNTNTVSFSVTAKRSIFEKLDDSDFTATADFNDMVVSDGGAKGSIKISITAKRYSSSLKFNGSSKMLLVSLEDAKSKQFTVVPTTEGTVAEGYALGDVSISGTNVIKVSGPANIVSRVTRVIAAINVDGMSQNISDNVVPVLFDEDGAEIDTTKLTLSRMTVTVSASILGTKKISVNLLTKGAPADGYALAGISSSMTSVWIKGATSVINPLTSVEIPGRVLDLTGATASIETTINITEYLPNGVSLLNSGDATISVRAEIEAYETREFEIPIENITVDGLALENELTYPQNVVYVSITGLAGDLDLLAAQSLRGIIDVTDLSTGSHVVTLELELDAAKYVVASSRIQINIDIKQEPEEDTGLVNPDENGGGPDGTDGGEPDIPSPDEV